MAVVYTLPFSGTPATEFDGSTADAGPPAACVLEFTGGRLHSKITGGADTGNSAYGHKDFGQDLTQGVLAIQDWELSALWTTGAAGNVVDIATLANAAFGAVAFVWLTDTNRWQLRIPTGSSLHSAAVNSAASSQTVSAATKYQLELAFKQNDYLRLFANGTLACEITGLSGGTGIVRKAYWGIPAATGTWTQNIDIFESEGKIDSDPLARPYSGAPAPPTVADPTGLTLIDADNATLKCSVQFSSTTGYRLLRKAGANQAAPASPTDAAWTLVSETSAGTGTRTVEITLPDNDNTHTIAVYGYNGSTYSAQSITTNVFALNTPVDILEFRSTYLVATIRTARAGSAKIEIHTTNAWVEGGNDSGTFNTDRKSVV